MKMKHLKTFENFGTSSDMGRFNDEENNLRVQDIEDHEEEFEEEGQQEEEFEEEGEEFGDPSMRRRTFGDDEEIIEKKKNPFAKYQAKKKAADKGKKEEKSDKKEEVKGKSGLTAAQRKLPAGLQAAILRKKK